MFFLWYVLKQLRDRYNRCSIGLDELPLLVSQILFHPSLGTNALSFEVEWLLSTKQVFQAAVICRTCDKGIQFAHARFSFVNDAAAIPEEDTVMVVSFCGHGKHHISCFGQKNRHGIPVQNILNTPDRRISGAQKLRDFEHIERFQGHTFLYLSAAFTAASTGKAYVVL